jgi:hypothetical protein
MRRNFGNNNSLNSSSSIVRSLLLIGVLVLFVMFYMIMTSVDSPPQQPQEQADNRQQQLQRQSDSKSCPTCTSCTPNRPRFHFVFNDDCHWKQQWPSFLLIWSFLSFYNIDSGSTLTQVTSCADAQFKPSWHGHMPSHVKSFVAKPYNELYPKIEAYSPFNKPLSLEQWLKSAQAPADDDVVVVIDPDFLFLRPLDITFANVSESTIYASWYALGDWHDLVKVRMEAECMEERYRRRIMTTLFLLLLIFLSLLLLYSFLIFVPIAPILIHGKSMMLVCRMFCVRKRCVHLCTIGSSTR